MTKTAHPSDFSFEKYGTQSSYPSAFCGENRAANDVRTFGTQGHGLILAAQVSAKDHGKS